MTKTNIPRSGNSIKEESHLSTDSKSDLNSESPSIEFGVYGDCWADIDRWVYLMKVTVQGEKRLITLNEAVLIAFLLKQGAANFSYAFTGKRSWNWMLTYMRQTRATFDRMVGQLTLASVVEKRHETTERSIVGLTRTFLISYCKVATPHPDGAFAPYLNFPQNEESTPQLSSKRGKPFLKTRKDYPQNEESTPYIITNNITENKTNNPTPPPLKVVKEGKSVREQLSEGGIEDAILSAYTDEDLQTLKDWWFLDRRVKGGKVITGYFDPVQIKPLLMTYQTKVDVFREILRDHITGGWLNWQYAHNPREERFRNPSPTPTAQRLTGTIAERGPYRFDWHDTTLDNNPPAIRTFRSWLAADLKATDADAFRTRLVTDALKANQDIKVFQDGKLVRLFSESISHELRRRVETPSPTEALYAS